MIGLLPTIFREETVRRAIDIKDYFSESDYFNFFFLDSSLNQEREIVKNALNEILNSNSLNSAQSSLLLQKKRLLTKKRLLVNLTQKPTLLNFLRQEESSILIWDWLLELEDKEAIHKLSFYHSVEDFKSVETRSLFPTRASAIIEKYINSTGENFIKMDEAIVNEIMNQFNSGNITRSIFASAQRDSYNTINQLFESNFLSTIQYKCIVEELHTIDKRIQFLQHIASDEDIDDGIIAEESNSSRAISSSRLSFWG